MALFCVLYLNGYAPINVKPEGGRGGADVEHLTFCNIF